MPLSTVVGSVSRLFRIHRSNYFLLLGVAAVLVAVAMDWYRQPSAQLSYIDASNQLVPIEGHSWVETGLRVVTGTFALAIAAMLVRRQPRWCAIWRATVLMLGVVSLFPSLRAHWEPSMGIDSSVVYIQVDRVVAQMEDAIPHQQMEWRHWLKIEPDAAVFGGVVEIPGVPGWTISTLSLARLHVALSDIFGLSNEFLNLITRWWIVAIVGSLLILLGCYLKANELARPGMIGGSQSGLLIVALYAIVIAPRLVGNYYEQLGQDAMARGEYNEASSHWRSELTWFPRARYALVWHDDLGRLDKLRGCTTCLNARLHDIFWLLNSNRLDEAVTQLYRALSLYPEDMRIRYWLGYSLVEQGIRAFNQRDYARARDTFQEALAFVPTHAMAWYGMAMANQQMGLHEAVISNIQQIVLIQSYLSFKRLTVKGESYLAKSWAAYKREDWIAAFNHYRDWLRPESW
jgi:tetratricopeptide (TPR) repeat protein